MRVATWRIGAAIVAVGLAAALAPAVAAQEAGDAVGRAVHAVPAIVTGPLVAPGRETEPVVLTGAEVAAWAVPADQTVAVPDFGGARCEGGFALPADVPVLGGEPCTPNTYEEPDVSRHALAPVAGHPVDRITAYRWDPDAGSFVQVPFQVDEVFTRYLSNNRSGFAFYSNTDAHTTYAFDREGFRWTASDEDDPCLAAVAGGLRTERDPVEGLDSDDELVFMARDAGPRAPSAEPVPDGVEDMLEVTVTDPYRPAVAGYVYLARTAPGGPGPAFDPGNGYVRYVRDADADVFRFSESSYDDYGNAPPGPYRDEQTGECLTDPDEWEQRRPGDQATVTTPRYRLRYEGRWLMTELQVSAGDDWQYGADLVDQWKARAFQQRPGGQTPCCGFEEEVNNWGGSSMLLGERWGPVRVVRETWGADSGTNVVRRETFYRDEIQQTTFLRVHPVPPLDGIYAQWDHNAGAVERYYNPLVPDGVAIDGKDDEVFGNSRLHIGPDGAAVEEPALGDDPVVVGEPDEPDCPPVVPVPEPPEEICTFNDIDTPDPLFSGPNAGLGWEQVSGGAGTLVTRWEVADVTAGTAAHTVFAMPYYRDDACFDDGTGSDPGPHLRSRRPDEDDPDSATWDDAGQTRPRECWDADRHDEDPAYAAHLGSRRFWQGSIGTHGLHLLLVAESDNAGSTASTTEIVSRHRMVVLPPADEPVNVGEAYGRGSEKPLVASVAPFGESSSPPAGEWVAGDLHVHTTYSHDSYGGSGDDNTGPDEAHTAGWTVAQQFSHAEVRGLDYLAITDHDDIRSQDDPGFDHPTMIALPGYETSLRGHAQMLGATRLYERGDRSPHAVTAMAEALRADGGVFQVNHQAKDSVDWPEDADWRYGYDVVPDTVEVWNISRLWQPPLPSASSNDDAVRYWEGWLDRGVRVAATGGSDNHLVATTAVQGVGQPTTWVLAESHDTSGVLAGLRRGRTFVSHQPPAAGGPRLFLEGDADGDGIFEAVVGDTVPPGAPLRVRGEGVTGGVVRVVWPSGEATVPVVGPSFVHGLEAPDSAWVRAELLLPDAVAERAAVCDAAAGGGTTYCRNLLLVQAMTSAIFVGTPATPTTVMIDAPSEGTHTDQVEITVALRTQDAPVPGRPLSLTLGSVVATADTGPDGTAVFAVPLADPPGHYEIVVGFGGDEELAPSRAKAPFSIRPETTVLSWSGPTRAQGTAVELAARLTEDDGPAVPGREVVFEARGEQWRATTGEDGVATTNAAVPGHGRSLDVTASFAGDLTHAGSNTETTIEWGGEPSDGRGRGEGGGVPAGNVRDGGVGAAIAAVLIMGVVVGGLWWRPPVPRRRQLR